MAGMTITVSSTTCQYVPADSRTQGRLSVLILGNTRNILRMASEGAELGLIRLRETLRGKA